RGAPKAEDLIAVLARAVRAVEAAVQRGGVTPAVRTKFQAVALLVREEHARVQGSSTLSEARRTAERKRLDGIATILATTAVRDQTLLALLAEDAVVSDAVRSQKREMLKAAGVEPAPEETLRPELAPTGSERGVVPQSVATRKLVTPFLAPDFSSAR